MGIAKAKSKKQKAKSKKQKARSMGAGREKQRTGNGKQVQLYDKARFSTIPRKRTSDGAIVLVWVTT
jgi:hypothetical protein